MDVATHPLRVPYAVPAVPHKRVRAVLVHDVVSRQEGSMVFAASCKLFGRRKLMG